MRFSLVRFSPAFTARRASSGYTLLELALILAVIGILAAFGVTSLGNLAEERDARMVQSAQASLQSIVSQGSARMDVTPRVLRDTQANAILGAIQDVMGENANSSVTFLRSGGRFVMRITPSGREAIFEITNTGDVQLTDLRKFTVYEVENGVIGKI